MARKISITGSVVLVIVATLLIAGEWRLHKRSQEVCGICARSINPHAGAIAEIGGVRRHVCCAHCAVTEGLQEHKPVKLIEVTDYNTGRKLDPSHAWFVDGSRMVACTHDMSRMNEMKQSEKVVFDRCAPGAFAFASHADAETFSARNGGEVFDLQHMLASLAGEAKP